MILLTAVLRAPAKFAARVGLPLWNLSLTSFSSYDYNYFCWTIYLPRLHKEQPFHKHSWLLRKSLQQFPLKIISDTLFSCVSRETDILKEDYVLSPCLGGSRVLVKELIKYVHWQNRYRLIISILLRFGIQCFVRLLMAVRTQPTQKLTTLSYF